jgi:hypothetical protein
MIRELRTEETLIDLYHLGGHDIEKIILADGRVGFDAVNKCFYVYIPSLEEYIRYPKHLHEQLLAKLQQSAYELELEDTVVSVDSPTQPPSGFLLLEDFEQQLSNRMDIRPETTLLVSSRINVPIFFGKDSTIKRLSEDFDGVSGVLSVQEFVQWKEQYVRS